MQRLVVGQGSIIGWLLGICRWWLEAFGRGCDGVGRGTLNRRWLASNIGCGGRLGFHEGIEVGDVDAEGSEGVGVAVFVFEEFHGISEAAGAAAAIAGGADVIFERAAHSFLDAFEFERVGSFAADDAQDFAHELASLASAEGAGFGAGEAVGKGAFEHPGGGPPMGAGGVLHRAQGAELGVHFGAAEMFVEVGVTVGFAADGVDAAADVFCGFLQAAATGDEGADFAAFGVGERAWPAGAGAVAM